MSVYSIVCDATECQNSSDEMSVVVCERMNICIECRRKYYNSGFRAYQMGKPMVCVYDGLGVYFNEGWMYARQCRRLAKL